MPNERSGPRVLVSLLSVLALMTALPAVAADEATLQSLEAKLAGMREESAAKMPAEARDTIKKSLDRIAASGVLDRMKKEGQPAPEFDLPSVGGGRVSSRELLARGPLVVTFYRGHW